MRGCIRGADCTIKCHFGSNSTINSTFQATILNLVLLSDSAYGRTSLLVLAHTSSKMPKRLIFTHNLDRLKKLFQHLLQSCTNFLNSEIGNTQSLNHMLHDCLVNGISDLCIQC